MEDKIVKVTTEDREMALLLKDGSKIPVKGKIIDTYYESGRHDAKVVMEKPLMSDKGPLTVIPGKITTSHYEDGHKDVKIQL